MVCLECIFSNFLFCSFKHIKIAFQWLFVFLSLDLDQMNPIFRRKKKTEQNSWLYWKALFHIVILFARNWKNKNYIFMELSTANLLPLPTCIHTIHIVHREEANIFQEWNNNENILGLEPVWIFNWAYDFANQSMIGKKKGMKKLFRNSY